MMKSQTFLFLICLMLSSCGVSDAEKLERTLTSVESLLTSGQCQQAIDKIESVTAANTNVLYLKLKASAYACRADYSTTTFFGTDLGLLTGTDLISSFTTFSISQNYIGPGDLDFADMQTAIDTLLYAGGLDTTENPSAALRAQRFDTTAQSDLNSFILYLVMNQLGKFFYYYGTTTIAGLKPNCIFNYSSDPALNLILAAVGGNCTATNAGNGHSDLGSAGTMNVARGCEAITLFNNFRDALANISTGDISTALATAITTIDVAIAAVPFTDTTIVTVKSQSKCEVDFASNNSDLEKYFGYVFELLHNRTVAP